MLASVLGDYLTFTVFYYGNNWGAVVKDILQMDTNLFEELPCGRYGYKNAVGYNSIIVYYGARETTGGDAGDRSMGVCVSMSGNGCRIYEEYSDDHDLMRLLKRLCDMYDDDNDSVHFARIDVAADDKAGILDLRVMYEYLNRRQVNTRLRKVGRNESFDLGDQVGDEALTYYIGAKTSDFRIRCYDKAKEQGDYDSHWVRIELQCRNDYALGAVRALVEHRDNVGACAAGMIRQAVLFVNADNERVERCTVAQWWDDFLQAVTKVKFFTKEKAKQSIDRVCDWVERQLSRSLGMVKLALGDDFLLEVAEYGVKMMTVAQRAIVADYTQRQTVYE